MKKYICSILQTYYCTFLYYFNTIIELNVFIYFNDIKSIKRGRMNINKIIENYFNLLKEQRPELITN